MNSWRGWSGLTVLLLAAGCSDQADTFASLSVTNNADNFFFVGQTFDRATTTTLRYEWQHTGTVARVAQGGAVQSVGTAGGLTGSASVTIRDASGTQVYAHDLREELVDTTAAGAPGNWTVDLAFTGVLGNAIFEAVKAPRDLTVTAETTGANLDPDGYSLVIDGGASQSLGLNGSATFSHLSPASHTVVLSGVAANCSVTGGGTTRSLTVSAAIPATVTFSVTCG